MSDKIAAIMMIVLLLSGAAPALAEHEVYYRYTVLGYLEDAAGKPRAGVGVELVREKTGFSYLGVTDAAGLYLVTARLGDESLGERLQLRVAGQQVAITARFDPADHAKERGTRVDFVRGQPTERPGAFHATLRRVLAD
jgi:hypothetical protein